MTSISQVYNRQGIVLDVDEPTYAKMKADRRQANIKAADEVIKRNGIVYSKRGEGYSNGSGEAWLVYGPGELYSNIPPEQVAYWPEIGRWIGKDCICRYGVRNLVKYLKGELS